MKGIFFSLIIFLICVVNSQKKRKCGLKSKIIPKSVEENLNENQYQFKRKLNNESDEYRDINIVLDYKNIETEIDLNDLGKFKTLIINSMNKAVETLKKIIKLNRPIGCFTFKEDFVEEAGFHYWDKERFGITNEKKNFSTCDYGIDLLIFTRFFNETEMKADNSSLMNAILLYTKQSNAQPIVGGILFDKYTDYSLKNSDRLLEYIFIHTMIHLLGFTNTYLKYFNYSYIDYDIYGNLRRYINSTKVIEVSKKYFNCNKIKGIELEDYSGSSGVHWESRILLGEYMNSIYLEEQVLSEFTLSFLDDLGYYKINYYTGGLMRYGKNKGCKFIQEKCVKNEEIDPYFENEFFDSINSDYYVDPSCSSGRQSRAYFAFWIKSYIPDYYNYFKADYGGFDKADFCPVSKTYYKEENNGYYVGNCNFGFGDYGTYIIYLKDNKEFYYKSGDIEKITGEKFTNHSFCYQSSLTKNDEPDFNIFSKVVRSICYETFCSSKSLTIKIHDNYIVCPRAGGKIEALGFGGFLLCPDYNLMCSGTVLCNDLYDCIYKKSTLKNDSYIYDYTIKTSQNIERAEEEDFDLENNYELSDDGICPKFCRQCTERSKCILCRSNFYLVGNKENKEEFKCVNGSLIDYGYYKENYIYYKCDNNCLKCYNDTYCIKCEDNYGLVSNKTNEHLQCKELNELQIGYYSINSSFIDYAKILSIKFEIEIYSLVYYECTKDCEICSNSFNCQKCRDKFVYNSNTKKCIIPNCEIYNSYGNCEKCYENYALLGNDENNCVEKNVLLDTTYYTKDGGKTYYSCDGEGDNHIKNCNKCNYNENNLISLYCQECIYGYTLLEDKEINKCYGINELKKNTYFSINETHMRNCSKEIKNCLECENKEKCIKCNNDYYLINKNGKNIFCADTNQVYPADEYYFDEKSKTYYYCNNSIEYCKKCLDASLCSLCIDGYSFVEGDKKKCIEISNLGKNYYQDPNDPLNYEPCSKFDTNCLFCSSYEKCTQCLENYEFNNESKCVNIMNGNSSTIKIIPKSSSSSGLIIGIIIGGGVVFLALIITIIIYVKNKCKSEDKTNIEPSNSEYINCYDINCTFKTNKGKTTTIKIKNDQTMNMLLFSYLNQNGQTEQFNKSTITFVYNNNIIDDNCPSKVGDYFQNNSPIIYVYGEEPVIGGNEKVKVTFKTQKGLEKIIYIEKTKSMGELIKLFLNEMGRPDLFNRLDLVQFLCNANKITNYNETVENLIASSHFDPVITAVGGQI